MPPFKLVNYIFKTLDLTKTQGLLNLGSIKFFAFRSEKVCTVYSEERKRPKDKHPQIKYVYRN